MNGLSLAQMLVAYDGQLYHPLKLDYANSRAIVQDTTTNRTISVNLGEDNVFPLAVPGKSPLDSVYLGHVLVDPADGEEYIVAHNGFEFYLSQHGAKGESVYAIEEVKTLEVADHIYLRQVEAARLLSADTTADVGQPATETNDSTAPGNAE